MAFLPHTTKCLHIETKVIDSRKELNHIYRRRQCLRCNERFSTYEIYIPGNPVAKLRRLEKFLSLKERDKSLILGIIDRFK